MGLETGSFISALVSTNPVGATDPKSQGDDHLRFIKGKILETFPNITGAVTASHTELNLLVGATAGIATLSVSFAAALASISAINTLVASMGTLSFSLTTSDITGSIRSPVLQAQAGYTAGTFTAATVTVNNKGVITNIAAGTTATNITLATPQATTSGTSITFGSIPAGTKRIVVNFSGVSTNGTSNLLIQLGDSGGIEATGYISAGQTNGTTISTDTTGLIVSGSHAASGALHGSVILNLENATSFAWCAIGATARSDGNLNANSGSKSLTAELTQIKIVAANGTDAFDAGEINISYT